MKRKREYPNHHKILNMIAEHVNEDLKEIIKVVNLIRKRKIDARLQVTEIRKRNKRKSNKLELVIFVDKIPKKIVEFQYLKKLYKERYGKDIEEA